MRYATQGIEVTMSVLRYALSEVQLAAVNAHDATRALQEKWAFLDPYDKHACAVSLVKVAEAQGVDVPADIYEYAGEKLSSEFRRHLKDRLDYTADDALREGYERLSKVASALVLEDVVTLLYTLDDAAGLLNKYSSRLPDPLLCVFGQEKKASEWSWSHGGEHVTASQLYQLARVPRRTALEKLLDTSLVSAFYSNPVKAFKSMSLDHKIIFSHMAAQLDSLNSGPGPAL
jgi:hypothetical protein